MAAKLSARFAALFDGLPRAYGIYEILTTTAKGKREGDARTLQAPVDNMLWERHLKGEIQLGIVPIRDDATCVFGAIDIDDYKTDHGALNAKIKKLKLPLVHCRSKSGGAHLYAFFSEPTPAERVRELLAGWAASLGYAAVEIFPKQSALHSASDIGNWINMPYSGGDKSERYALAPNRLSAEAFLDKAEKSKIGQEILDSTEEFPELLQEAPPCLITLANHGIPEGQRNNTLFALAVYCKKRWPGEYEEKIVELNANFVMPPLTSSEVAEVIKGVGKKDYNYPCKQEPICSVCQKSVCRNRQYGAHAQAQVDTFGYLFENVVRLEVDPVVYYADFAGRRINFGSKHLVNQGLMRLALMEQTNSVPVRMTTRAYDAFMNNVSSKALIVEAPMETSWVQRILSLVHQYCVASSQRSWKSLQNGGARNFEGRTYFDPHALVNDVNAKHKLGLTESDLWTALQQAGVQTAERNKMKFWHLPEIQKEEAEEEDAL